MKRGFQISKEDNHKLMMIMKHLFQCGVDFEAHYKANGDSVILFECDDQFYETMLDEVPKTDYSWLCKA